MSRHINHFDVQDRIMTRFNKQNRTTERDCGTLTLAEQLRRAEIKPKKQEVIVKAQLPRFAGWVVVKIIP